MQQSVPLSITAEDGTIDFQIVIRLEDKKIKTGMETRDPGRQHQANLQVDGAASKSLAYTWGVISGNGGLYCSYKDQDLIHYNRKCVLYVPLVNTEDVAGINKS